MESRKHDIRNTKEIWYKTSESLPRNVVTAKNTTLSSINPNDFMRVKNMMLFYDLHRGGSSLSSARNPLLSFFCKL